MLGAPAFLGNKAVFTQSRMVRASGLRSSVGVQRFEQGRPSGVHNADGQAVPRARREELEGATGRELFNSLDHPGVGLLQPRGCRRPREFGVPPASAAAPGAWATRWGLLGRVDVGCESYSTNCATARVAGRPVPMALQSTLVGNCGRGRGGWLCGVDRAPRVPQCSSGRLRHAQLGALAVRAFQLASHSLARGPTPPPAAAWCVFGACTAATNRSCACCLRGAPKGITRAAEGHGLGCRCRLDRTEGPIAIGFVRSRSCGIANEHGAGAVKRDAISTQT